MFRRYNKKVDMSFSCSKCGGKKISKAARCKNPCTSSVGECEQTKSDVVSFDKIQVVTPRVDNGLAKVRTDEKRTLQQNEKLFESSTTSSVDDLPCSKPYANVQKLNFTKEELFWMNLPFDDDRFRLYGEIYVDPHTKMINMTKK